MIINLAEIEKVESLFPFEIEEIKKQTIDQLTFSSTLIRKHLAEGEIEKANLLMGHPFLLQGTVVKGLQNGKKLGFPTANIQLNFKNKLIPADSSYIVKVKLEDNKYYSGMLNIGQRPTLNAGQSIEVHILDFDGEIYGESIKIEFFKKLRDEKKFNDLDALKDQLKKDLKITADFFHQH